MPTRVEDIRRALAARAPTRVPLSGLMRQAAVSVVARDTDEGAHLLFIRRAEHDGDPWSGHMAFPGGRVDPGDASPLAAALRETREEVDLDLAALAHPIGELSHVPAMAHGRPLPLVVHPFAFALDDGPLPALRENHEVQETLWIPLDVFRDPARRETMEWRVAGLPVPLPCYRVEGRVVWGLTLRMIDDLVERLDRT